MTSPVTLPARLPEGFRIALDPGTRQLTGDLLSGGSPARVLRLTGTGRAAWRELRGGPVCSPAAGVLARSLTDAGLAHPRPPRQADAPGVTVVIPAKDRVTLLARCLAAVGRAFPVTVVDDGSRDRRAMETLVRHYGASLIRRESSGGPGAARNTALQAVRTELVAFVDSDCEPDPGWISQLADHFADPLVAAVAPRVRGIASSTWAGRYTAANGSLDMGEREARVAPNTRVSYVPAAALLARRTALLDIARDGEVFDQALSTGEDVDLVWRLDEAGWRVRYDPAAQAGHHEPGTWAGLLARRFRYGRSAAPLALRHPAAVPPLVLHPWPALTVAALLARQPAWGAVAFGSSVLIMNRTLSRARVPASGVPQAMLTGVRQTWLGIGRYGRQFGAPLLLLAIAAPGGGTMTRRWGRRAATGSLLLGPSLAAWAASRPALDPARFALGDLADDVAYGGGVLAGCLVTRTSVPLRPVISWRPLRITARDGEGGARDGG